MSETPKAKILLVDDAVRLRSRLEDFLQTHNFSIMSLADGEKAQEAICEFQPDLMLLDVMMPGHDGFEVLRSVRQTSSIPIIMLTACNNRDDRVKGLDQGADDYLGKPFHLGELLARIRAVLRRSHSQVPSGDVPEEPILRSGPLSLDISQRKLNFFQKDQVSSKNLTNLEFRLVYLFLNRQGEILSRDEILDYIFESRVSVDGQSLRVYINRLRKILEEIGLDPRTLATVWGSGYRFNLPAS
jgi:DNA-binding response OmpR family regulator